MYLLLTILLTKTIFNFHINNFDTIIENIIENKVVTFKKVKSNNKNWRINKFLIFCSTFKQETYLLPLVSFNQTSTKAVETS